MSLNLVVVSTVSSQQSPMSNLTLGQQQAQLQQQLQILANAPFGDSPLFRTTINVSNTLSPVHLNSLPPHHLEGCCQTEEGEADHTSCAKEPFHSLTSLQAQYQTICQVQTCITQVFNQFLYYHHTPAAHLPQFTCYAERQEQDV